MALFVLGIIAVVAVPLVVVAFFSDLPTWLLVVGGVVVVVAIIGYVVSHLNDRLPM